MDEDIYNLSGYNDPKHRSYVGIQFQADFKIFSNQYGNSISQSEQMLVWRCLCMCQQNISPDLNDV